MPKNLSFGNSKIAEKMTARFGEAKETIKVEMKYTKQVTEFIQKIEKAHEQAAKSKIVFR